MTSRKKHIITGLTAAAGAASLFVGYTGSYLASLSAGGNRQTLEEALQWQSSRYDIHFMDDLDTFAYTISGYEGYVIHAQFFKNPQPSGKYIILTHGYTDNRFGALKYMKIYLDRGYNCIIYDLRGHGENAPSPCTYGILEAKDLLAVIDDTHRRFGEDITLGLHGESLGAATTATVMQYCPRVDFAVADCGFSEIEGVRRAGYRNAGVPVFLVDLADLGTRMRYGFALKDARPIDALDANEVPVLFIHGADDNLIAPENSERMFGRARGPRAIHFIDGAGHAESAIVAPEAYRAVLEGFLEQLG